MVVLGELCIFWRGTHYKCFRTSTIRHYFGDKNKAEFLCFICLQKSWKLSIFDNLTADQLLHNFSYYSPNEAKVHVRLIPTAVIYWLHYMRRWRFDESFSHWDQDSPEEKKSALLVCSMSVEPISRSVERFKLPTGFLQEEGSWVHISCMCHYQLHVVLLINFSDAPKLTKEANQSFSFGVKNIIRRLKRSKKWEPEWKPGNRIFHQTLSCKQHWSSNESSEAAVIEFSSREFEL